MCGPEIIPQKNDCKGNISWKLIRTIEQGKKSRSDLNLTSKSLFRSYRVYFLGLFHRCSSFFDSQLGFGPRRKEMKAASKLMPQDNANTVLKPEMK